MSSIANNDFQIADLIAVRYSEDYLDYLDDRRKEQLKGVLFYPDTIYFLEKITSFDNGIYNEYYQDVLYAVDVFEREAREPFRMEPDFLEVVPFPTDLLTKEEREKGTITRWRLFTIFQVINAFPEKEMAHSSVKRYGTRLKTPRVG